MRKAALRASAAGQPLRKGRLHRAVVDRLALDIVRGRHRAGALLPVEADLSAALEVGRSSLREAVRVLVDKGMLEVKPRIGTRVTARGAWRRLDPDVIRWTLSAGPDPEFFSALIEARRIFEPAAAELAAKRATAGQVAAIEAAFLGMAAAIPHQLDTCVAHDLAFHRAVLAASGNPVLLEFEAIIDAALSAAFRLSTSLSDSYESTLDAHRVVLDAIRLRDAARARAAMLGLLQVAERDLGIGKRKRRQTRG
jgi:DNA-binding FadR family transcriptional regulator